MQAVLLAGGMGTRLRPLTYAVPKPLLPLVGRPLLEHVMERLPEKVDEVFLTASYKVDQLRRYARSVTSARKITVVEEREPLGTGGAVKQIEDGLEDDFVVLNADVLASVDIDAMAGALRSSPALGIVALWRTKEPWAFGVVEWRAGRILRFVEKPKPGDEPSDLINAGVYVFKREILERIPDGRPVSLEREVFPVVAKEGLLGHTFTGYWTDAGTLDGYLMAQRILLDAAGRRVHPEARVRNATLRAPLAVDEGAAVDGGVLGPYAWVGAGAALDGCTLVNAAVLPGARAADCVVRRAIVGPKKTLRRGTTLEDAIAAVRVRS